MLVDERLKASKSIFCKHNSRISRKLVDTVRHAVTAVLCMRRESAAHYDVCFCLLRANMLLIPIYLAVFLLAAAPTPSVRTRSNTMTSAV